MDARTQAWIDQEDAHLTVTIRRHGWAIQYVGGDSCSAPGCECQGGDGPPLAYTIGLFGMGHPELLILGCPPDLSASVLNCLGGRIRNGEDLVAGQVITIANWTHRMIPETVPNPGEIVLGSNRFYERPPEASVPAFQLAYDDGSGRFPWEDGYAAPEAQPRPGTFRA